MSPSSFPNDEDSNQPSAIQTRRSRWVRPITHRCCLTGQTLISPSRMHPIAKVIKAVLNKILDKAKVDQKLQKGNPKFVKD